MITFVKRENFLNDRGYYFKYGLKLFAVKIEGVIGIILLEFLRSKVCCHSEISIPKPW